MEDDHLIPISQGEKIFYMKEALFEAQKAYDTDEVPVGCVFVRPQLLQQEQSESTGKVRNSSFDQKKYKFTIMARSHNLTNKLQNASRHCQINCFIDQLQNVDCNKLILFVTVEPCIMCSHALNIMGVKQVYFGQHNDRFGGCGSVMNSYKYHREGGIFQEKSALLMQQFYSRGNQKIPEQMRNKSRRKKLKLSESSL